MYAILAIDGDLHVISWNKFFYKKGCWVFSQAWVYQNKLFFSSVVFLFLLCPVNISRSFYFHCNITFDIFTV